MIYIIAAIILLFIWLFKPSQSLRSKETLEQEIGALKSQLASIGSIAAKFKQDNSDLQNAFEKLQHQKKSSEVRTGFLGEALLPLHESFPVDPKTMRFLGSPIDYISFCYETDMITFVEVKTGDSQLNENQRAVKKMVEAGKVQFKVVRLNEKGVKMKFKKGDFVACIFPDDVPHGKTGTILNVRGYLNENSEWCCLVAWDNEKEDTQHPKYLKKLSKLERALK